MSNFEINTALFLEMLESGANNLSNDCERINALNVFPVPDGDTGTNMTMTINGGVKAIKGSYEKNLGELTKQMSRGMVMNARGNSGVILSQFFKGMSTGFAGLETSDVVSFAKAIEAGYKKAYSVVSNPTEGTILTVMREASENTVANIEMSIEEFLQEFIKNAKKSLDNTPNLLPVLKKAGVVDSGGAGFILIIEGMLKACLGEGIADITEVSPTTAFDASSELFYGYSVKFVLQLQNSKVDVKSFDANNVKNYLNSIGTCIECYRNGDTICGEVYTFDPGIALTEGRKYGELLSVQIENLDLVSFDVESVLNAAKAKEAPREHKKYAIVCVANGTGLVKAFKSIGVDEVVTGGQTMNTSTQDFLAAFEKIDADNILVYPNNGNIIMAAKMACETYTKANCYVVPTKSIAEGYSAVSMLDTEFASGIEEILECQKEVIDNVSTLEVTYSIRDAEIDGINIKKGDFICLYDGKLISCHKKRLEALKKAIKAIPDFCDKQVLTVLCGQDVKVDEVNVFTEYVKFINKFIEVYPISGEQDIYSYIIGVE